MLTEYCKVLYWQILICFAGSHWVCRLALILRFRHCSLCQIPFLDKTFFQYAFWKAVLIYFKILRTFEVGLLFCRYTYSGLNMIEGSRETVIMTLGRVFELRPTQAEKLFTEVLQCMRKRDLVSINIIYTSFRLNCVQNSFLAALSFRIHSELSEIRSQYSFFYSIILN